MLQIDPRKCSLAMCYSCLPEVCSISLVLFCSFIDNYSVNMIVLRTPVLFFCQRCLMDENITTKIQFITSNDEFETGGYD